MTDDEARKEFLAGINDAGEAFLTQAKQELKEYLDYLASQPTPDPVPGPIPDPIPTPGPDPVPTPDPVPDPRKKKWYPGHYGLDEIQRVCDSDLKGCLVMYQWGDTEVGKGKYDFSQIERDRDQLARAGKTLSIQMQCRDFANNPDVKYVKKCAPEYIWDAGGVYYGDYKKGQGWRAMAKLYDPQTRDALIRWVQAIASKFDKDASIAAVMLPETAGQGGEGKGEEHVDGIIKIGKACGEYFANTVWFQMCNYLGGHPDSKAAMRAIFENCRLNGGGVSGPDLIPGHTAASILYKPYLGKMPLAIQSQSLDKRCKSMDEAWKFAHQELEVNMNYWKMRGDSPFTYPQVLDYLKKRNYEIRTDLPENLSK